MLDRLWKELGIDQVLLSQAGAPRLRGERNRQRVDLSGMRGFDSVQDWLIVPPILGRAVVLVVGHATTFLGVERREGARRLRREALEVI